MNQEDAAGMFDDDADDDRFRPDHEVADNPFSQCVEAHEVLRDAWEHVRALDQELVVIWTVGGRRQRGRKGAVASRGLPQGPVRSTILRPLLDDPVLKHARNDLVSSPKDAVLSPEQVTPLKKVLECEAQRIVRALRWATDLRAMYEHSNELRNDFDQVFVGSDNKFKRARLTEAILRAVWSKVADDALPDLREVPPEDQEAKKKAVLNEILADQVTTAWRGDTAACRRVLSDPAMRRDIEEKIREGWAPAPQDEGAPTDAAKEFGDLTACIAGARMRRDEDGEALTRVIQAEHEPVDERLRQMVSQCEQDGSDARRLARTCMTLGLSRRVEQSSFRRPPLPRWEGLARASERKGAADDPQQDAAQQGAADDLQQSAVEALLRQAPLDLDYVLRVLHVFKNKVSQEFTQDRLPEVLKGEARRCCHYTGLGWVQSRLMIVMGALVVELVLQEADRVLGAQGTGGADREDPGPRSPWHPRSLVSQAVQAQVLKRGTAVRIALRPDRSAARRLDTGAGALESGMAERRGDDELVTNFVSSMTVQVARTLWYRWHRHEFLGEEDGRDGFSVEVVQKSIYYAVKQACIDASGALKRKEGSLRRWRPRGGRPLHPALSFIGKIQRLRADEPYASVYALMLQYMGSGDEADGPGTISGRNRELRDEVPQKPLRSGARRTSYARRATAALALREKLDFLSTNPQVGPMLNGVGIEDVLDCLDRM